MCAIQHERSQKDKGNGGQDAEWGGQGLQENAAESSGGGEEESCGELALNFFFYYFIFCSMF